MRRVFEALACKPTPVRLCPLIATGGADAAMAQWEGKQRLALEKIITGSFARPNQITDSFVLRTRHPNPSELAGPMQPGKRN